MLAIQCSTVYFDLTEDRLNNGLTEDDYFDACYGCRVGFEEIMETFETEEEAYEDWNGGYCETQFEVLKNYHEPHEIRADIYTLYDEETESIIEYSFGVLTPEEIKEALE